MYTLEKIKQFTQIEKNHFIDEVIYLIDNYFDFVSIISAIKMLTDIEYLPNSNLISVMNSLGIDGNKIIDHWSDKEGSIKYLESIKCI